MAIYLDHIPRISTQHTFLVFLTYTLFNPKKVNLVGNSSHKTTLFGSKMVLLQLCIGESVLWIQDQQNNLFM